MSTTVILTVHSKRHDVAWYEWFCRLPTSPKDCTRLYAACWHAMYVLHVTPFLTTNYTQILSALFYVSPLPDMRVHAPNDSCPRMTLLGSCSKSYSQCARPSETILGSFGHQTMWHAEIIVVFEKPSSTAGSVTCDISREALVKPSDRTTGSTCIHSNEPSINQP